MVYRMANANLYSLGTKNQLGFWNLISFLKIEDSPKMGGLRLVSY